MWYLNNPLLDGICNGTIGVVTQRASRTQFPLQTSFSFTVHKIKIITFNKNSPAEVIEWIDGMYHLNFCLIGS